MPGTPLPRKRLDGTTVYRAQWRPPGDGRDTSRRTKTFATRREANRWIADQDSAHHAGTYTDPRDADRATAQVIEEWRDTWADLAPKTQVGYQSILNRHVIPALGDRRIGDVTPADLQRFVNQLAKTHAPNTVRRVMDVTRNILNLAVARRYIVASPADPLRLPGKTKTKIQPLTHEELNQFVAQLPEHWRLPVLLDAYTGLRAGELWALRRNDIKRITASEVSVDEAIKEVTVEAAQGLREEQRLTPSLIVGPTKTYQTRKVSVPDFLRAPLLAHLAHDPHTAPEAFVFTTPEGQPVRHNLLYKRVFAPATEAAFPDRPTTLRFHDLRHTCAAWLIDKGAHPLQIKLRLGHESIRTTMDCYGHLFPSAEPEMADLLDAGYKKSLQPPDNVRRLPRAEPAA
jgi:integrase